MRKTVVINKAHNYLRITDYSEEFVNRVIMPFCRRYLYKYAKKPIPGTRKTQSYVSHVFARMNNDKTEFRISAGLLKEFLSFMEYCGYAPNRALVLDEPEIVPTRVQFEWNKGWGGYKPGSEQEQKEWCDYQIADGPIKVNNAGTGVGKSFCATKLMVDMGVRGLITALPRYIPIWSKCLFQYLKLSVEDVVYVESGGLEELAENIQKGIINPKIIILPLTRIDSHYKRMREDDTVPDLDELYAKMGIGLRIMDEGHESVYQVYMSMLYGNFSKTLALSATLKADDALQNRIYSYIYPQSIRLKDGESKKYIDVYAYHHWIDIRKFRINPRGFGGYNHVKFEQGIMKSPYLLGRYYELCKQAFEEFYVKDLLPEQKALWFFATVEMCVNMLEFFKRDYPEMDFGKYTNAESSKADTKDDYLKHQVLITTPQSCSTGKDIEKLYVAFSPYAVSSKQRNAQSLGRLREITKWWPDLSPKYVYFVCQNVDKQVDYHRKRMEEFANKAKSITNINSGHSIP